MDALRPRDGHREGAQANRYGCFKNSLEALFSSCHKGHSEEEAKALECFAKAAPHIDLLRRCLKNVGNEQLINRAYQESPELLPKMIAIIDTQGEEALRETSIMEAWQSSLTLPKMPKCILQPGWKVARMEKLKQISRLLITSTGEVNVSLIDDLASSFVTKKAADGNIAAVLNAMKNNPHLLDAAADHFMMRGNILIHIFNGTPLDEPIKECDAKRFVLTALMTHLRQESVTSCFATNLAIQQMLLQPQRVLNDFLSILKHNKLVRKIDNALQEFPLTYLIHDQLLENVMTIRRDGSLLCGSYLWATPGMAAIIQTLQIDKEGQQNVLRKIFDATSSDIETLSIRNFLQLLSEEGVDVCFPELTKEEFIYLTFVSQTVHPLVKIWENGIADMAEAQEEGVIKSSLLESVTKTLQDPFPSLAEVIKTALSRRTRYRFDPTISSQRKNISGGFVLYDFDLKTKEWRRIDTPDRFQRLLAFIAKTSCPDKRALCRYVKTATFLRAALSVFNPENRQMLVDSSLKNILFAPWISYSGNDPRRVREVFTETRSICYLSHHPETAHELLLFLIRTAYKTDQTVLPVSISGVHSFSLTLNHPLFIRKSRSIEKTVSKKLINPSIKLSKRVLTYKEASDLLLRMRLAFPLPRLIKIRDLHNLVMERLTKQRERHAWDRIMFAHLPNRILTRLHRMTVPFADTNWCQSDQDVYLAICPHPGTGKLMLCRILENGALLRPLQQRTWVKGQTWKIIA